jgi:hypothetical protein
MLSTPSAHVAPVQVKENDEHCHDGGESALRSPPPTGEPVGTGIYDTVVWVTRRQSAHRNVERARHHPVPGEVRGSSCVKTPGHEQNCPEEKPGDDHRENRFGIGIRIGRVQQSEHDTRDDERKFPSRRASQHGKDVATNEKLFEERCREKEDRRVTGLPPPASRGGGVYAEHVRRKKKQARESDRESAEHGALYKDQRRRGRAIESDFAPGQVVDSSQHDPRRGNHARETDPLGRDAQRIRSAWPHGRHGD